MEEDRAYIGEGTPRNGGLSLTQVGIYSVFFMALVEHKGSNSGGLQVCRA